MGHGCLATPDWDDPPPRSPRGAGVGDAVAMPDRRTPFTVGSEKQILLDFLDYLRGSIVVKLSGLSDDDARESRVSSGTSLMGLVKHLTYVEVGWFHYAFGGLEVTMPSGDLDPSDTVENVIGAYEAACRRGSELITACSDLSELCPHAGGAPEPMTRRWVLIHMVEETARHAGHADILREQIDGTVGR